MAGSDSPTVDVAATLGDAALVGGPGSYLARPGFWHGGIGVAAVWHGGAVGVATALRRAAATLPLSPHAAAHLGGVEVALAAGESVLGDSARAIDDDPLDQSGEASGTPGSSARSSSGRPPRCSSASAAPSAPRRSVTTAPMPAASLISPST